MWILNEESEAKLQAVAKEIEDETGLITDVTLGSSPQYAVTYLPGLKGESALGWIQQPWIKLGSSITIFQEAKLGFSGVVAMLYVFNSNIIMLYARKKEFAILLSLGWRPSQLSKLLFLEATILGSMVALISWMILGTLLWTAAGSTSIARILLIGLAGLLIYWLGTLILIRLVQKIKPYETMQSGEVSKGRRLLRSRSSVGLSLNQLVTYWPRTTLSILAIALPTSLFGFFLFVTFRLQGVLYTTWIGEFVALEVGTMHYVAMGVALLIAMLTTTEIMWQNVSERKPQLAVLKALGWQNTSIRRLVLTEGALTGFFAGLLGVTVTIIIVTIMYQQFPTSELPFLFATILIPVVTDVLGAILPAERAVCITPAEAIGGHVVNQKKVEKRFRLVLGTTATALVVGIIRLFVFTSPEVKPVTEEAKTTPAPTAQTTGAKQADLKADKPKEAKATTPKEDDLQRIMDLGTFQTFIGDPRMKKREFQVGQPVFASPDGTNRKMENDSSAY
ncbi:FtsX-like permease family protein [Exiguobacterium aurantiacum]|uniref:ABC transporter permease n=1 Tax=Exiguobacterium aurantiacum TaxID=33987 RepID=UPI003CFDD77A